MKTLVGAFLAEKSSLVYVGESAQSGRKVKSSEDARLANPKGKKERWRGTCQYRFHQMIRGNDSLSLSFALAIHHARVACKIRGIRSETNGTVPIPTCLRRKLEEQRSGRGVSSLAWAMAN